MGGTAFRFRAIAVRVIDGFLGRRRDLTAGCETW